MSFSLGVIVLYVIVYLRSLAYKVVFEDFRHARPKSFLRVKFGPIGFCITLASLTLVLPYTIFCSFSFRLYTSIVF